jgi:hypothetical protein
MRLNKYLEKRIKPYNFNISKIVNEIKFEKYYFSYDINYCFEEYGIVCKYGSIILYDLNSYNIVFMNKIIKSGTIQDKKIKL